MTNYQIDEKKYANFLRNLLHDMSHAISLSFQQDYTLSQMGITPNTEPEMEIEFEVYTNDATDSIFISAKPLNAIQPKISICVTDPDTPGNMDFDTEDLDYLIKQTLNWK